MEETPVTVEKVSAAKLPLRRTSTEIRERILDAARGRFAAGGMDGATTRAIAEDAAVAEHLIFRNFQSKANLFDEAVIRPFTAVFGEFLTTLGTDEEGQEFRNRTVMRKLYRFLRDNSAFLQALVKSSGQTEDKLAHAFDDYFRIAEQRLTLFYKKTSDGYDISPALFVRYAFGMVASAVLLEKWFFPDEPVDDEQAASALSRIAFKAMQPLLVTSRDQRSE